MTTRHYVFTLNNPDGTYEPDLQGWFDSGHLDYACWQMEMGESGTLHLQGYIELSRSQRLSFVRKVIPGAHWEHRRGTREQARDYARKDDTRVDGPWEIGVWVPGGSGRRTDIHEYADAIKGRASLTTLFESFPRQFLAYQRGTMSAIGLYAIQRSWPTELHLLIGPPGCGKTRFVTDNAPNCYWKPPNNKWWDQYSGQEDVCLDDFYGSMPYNEILRLADRTPLQLEVKGGMVQFLAKRLWITSNKVPLEWWKDEVLAKYDFGAFTRRVTKLYVWENGSMVIYDGYQDFLNRPAKFIPPGPLPGNDTDYY